MTMRELSIGVLLAIVAMAVYFLFIGCSTMHVDPVVQLPSPTPAPTASPVSQPADDISIAQEPVSPQALKLITDIAGKSACAAYYWKDRGHAPKGYFKGVALVYAKALCHPERTENRIISNPVMGNVSSDAVAHYDLKGGDTLQEVYTLLLGLGLRESSGKYCCGRDMSAGFSSASSAEAGTFQTSYGAAFGKNGIPRAGGALVDLYKKYKADGKGCFLDVFKEGASCGAGDSKNWGTGEGFTWQALTKRCPAFGAEYAAMVLRVNGGAVGEFGPIRRKAAEYRPECVSMLGQVKQLVSQNPELCTLL